MKQKFINFLKLSTFTLLTISLQGCLFAGLAAATGVGAYYVGKKASQRGDERIRTETLIQAREEMEAKQKELAANDTSMQNQINSKVASGAATSQIAVYPEVKNGVVILHGRVPDAQTADRVIAATRQTQGVSQIISNLVITNQAQQKPKAAAPQYQAMPIALQPQLIQPQVLQPQYVPQQVQPYQVQQPMYQQQQMVAPQQQYIQQPVQQQQYQQPQPAYGNPNEFQNLQMQIQQQLQQQQYQQPAYPIQTQPVAPEQFRTAPSPYGNVQGYNNRVPVPNFNTSQTFVAKTNFANEYEKKNYLNSIAPKQAVAVPVSIANSVRPANAPRSQASLYDQILAANQQPPPTTPPKPILAKPVEPRPGVMSDSLIDSYSDSDSEYVPVKPELEAKRRRLEQQQMMQQPVVQQAYQPVIPAPAQVQPTIIAIPVPVPVMQQPNYEMYRDADEDYVPLGAYNPYKNTSSGVYAPATELTAPIASPDQDNDNGYDRVYDY